MMHFSKLYERELSRRQIFKEAYPEAYDSCYKKGYSKGYDRALANGVDESVVVMDAEVFADAYARDQIIENIEILVNLIETIVEKKNCSVSEACVLIDISEEEYEKANELLKTVVEEFYMDAELIEKFLRRG